MNCIIVDDEPLAREAVQLLVDGNKQLTLLGSFNNATSASRFMNENRVDLIFLDIRMPGVTGIEFARTIDKSTLVIFTTAFSEYALDSYEVDAVDYLVKPIEADRFTKAVDKAVAYHSLLLTEETEDNKEDVKSMESEWIFVKSERRYFKVNLKDILFIEGLKDYVIIQQENKRIITKMNLKGMHELLPSNLFLRVNRSYIVNINQIDSFDNNDIFIKSYEIGIGNTYRESFFDEFMSKRM